MAKRKSVLIQLLEAQRKAAVAHKRDRERAAREFAKNQEQIRRETEAEQRAQAQAEEKRIRDQARAAEQEAKARARNEKALQAAEAKAALERQYDDARQKTENVAQRLKALDNILIDRHIDLRERSIVVGRAVDEGSDEFAREIERQIAQSHYPDGVETKITAQYYPESRELMLDCELPRRNVVPDAVAYRYRPRDRQIRPDPRKPADIRNLYQMLIGRVTIRAIAEIFYATPAPLVDSVIYNGFVSAKDRGTGQPIRPCVISLSATREIFDGLVLDEPELDPKECLERLHAIMSRHPYDLEAVKPVLYFDPSKYKLIDEVGDIAGLDHRLDLLALSPVEFEYLIQRLFEQVGMKSWVRNTQASKDEGVDAVAVNEDPLVGGVCVIQAKRWKDVVGLESVHALAGVMGDKAATRGILVTTSWFGKASIDFVTRHGRMQLIDGRNLKNMLTEHLGLDVLIGLPKIPRNWRQEDVG